MVVFNYIKHIGIVIVMLLLIYLLNPFNLTIKAGYALIGAFIVLRANRFVQLIDRNFLLLLLFSITFSMFNYFGENKGIQYLIIQATFPYFFYALGKLMVTKETTEKGLIHLIIILGFTYSFDSLLSIIFNLKQSGFAQTDRFIPSFWSGTPIKATTMASYMFYNSVIPAILVANKNRLSLFWHIVYTGFFLITLVCSFRLGSRTLIVIAVLSMLASIGYLVINQSAKQNIRLLFFLIVLLGGIFVFAPIDLDSPIFSTLGHRIQTGGGVESASTAGNRTTLWAEGVEKLIEHPLGWESRMHHHNLWLDMAKLGGIVPFLFFLTSNVFCFLDLRKAFRLSGKDLGINVIFLAIFLSSFLFFFTEPVIEGNFFSIVIFCLFFGVMRGYIEKKKWEKENAISTTNDNSKKSKNPVTLS